MKLATEHTGSADGRLLIVSRDLSAAVPASGIVATLQEALERWHDVSPALQSAYERLNAGGATDAFELRGARLMAPLPRAWQWLDGSAFPTHGLLMQKAFDVPPIESSAPLMYQGLSHQFLGPAQDVPLPCEEDYIDFEGEFGVITDEVPMGASPAQALRHIRLAVQINDWSLRRIAPQEMKTGFGWIQAKPACSMAPIAVTLDELSNNWREGRIAATLEVRRNGVLFGAVPATEMAFGFHELIAYAAGTRSLCAGSIVGSGTISSGDYRNVGSCCIAERRAIEMLSSGSAQTPFLSFGESIRMEARDGVTAQPLFGVLDQRVVKAVPVGR